MPLSCSFCLRQFCPPLFGLFRLVLHAIEVQLLRKTGNLLLVQKQFGHASLATLPTCMPTLVSRIRHTPYPSQGDTMFLGHPTSHNHIKMSLTSQIEEDNIPPLYPDRRFGLPRSYRGNRKNVHHPGN